MRMRSRPRRAREIGGRDGGIIGPPPREGSTTRLYLSGPGAQQVADLFAGTAVDARVLGDEIGAASALKMTLRLVEGTAAMLAIRDVARAEGVEDALLDTWRAWIPELFEEWEHAESAAGRRLALGREMEEIADTSSRPAEGFHRAAAEVFRARVE